MALSIAMENSDHFKDTDGVTTGVDRKPELWLIGDQACQGSEIFWKVE